MTSAIRRLEHCVSPRIQQNLRLERSLEAEQGTKMLKSKFSAPGWALLRRNTPGSARLVRYLRWAPQRWPIKAWECRVITCPWIRSETVWLAGRCEVTTSVLQTTGWFSKLPGRTAQECAGMDAVDFTPNQLWRLCGWSSFWLHSSVVS